MKRSAIPAGDGTGEGPRRGAGFFFLSQRELKIGPVFLTSLNLYFLLSRNRDSDNNDNIP